MKRLTLLLINFVLIIFIIACNNTYELHIPNKNDKVTNSEEISESNINDDSIQINNDLSALIPDGWRILTGNADSVVKGDLNKDGIPDVAFVIEKITSNENSPPRVLMIASGNKNKSYDLIVKAEKVILKKDEGGIMGDPFMGLEINRGSLLISHYGGSAWRWGNTYRFRFQNSGFYLIGATEDWFHATSNAGRVYEDVNLLTGDYIRIETDDNGVEKKIKSNRGKNKLVNLIDFETNGKSQF